MSNYSQTNDFSAKDALSSGDPNKIIYGADIDTELSAISTAITSKSNKVGSATNNNVAKLDSNGDLVDSGYRFTNISGAMACDFSIFNSVTALASSDDVVDNFPSGTKMLFQQTSAPTGWTKDTTHNDKALRIVSGTVGTGGSSSFSTVFGKTATDGHTLTITEMPSHDHGGSTTSNGGHSHTLGFATSGSGGIIDKVDYDATQSSSYGTTDAVANHSHTISSQGSGGSHSHDMDIQVQYVDVIIASKD